MEYTVNLWRIEESLASKYILSGLLRNPAAPPFVVSDCETR